MTPKEKAIELFDKYDYYLHKEYDDFLAKQCALIAVDEIRYLTIKTQNYEEAVYWRDVKQEIEKL